MITTLSPAGSSEAAASAPGPYRVRARTDASSSLRPTRQLHGVFHSWLLAGDPQPRTTPCQLPIGAQRTLLPRSARICRCTRGERRPGAATRCRRQPNTDHWAATEN
jgi:hypothetical protein